METKIQYIIKKENYCDTVGFPRSGRKVLWVEKKKLFDMSRVFFQAYFRQVGQDHQQLYDKMHLIGVIYFNKQSTLPIKSKHVVCF